MNIVGVVDYHGQPHCMEHANTLSSYDYELYETSEAHECWCGEVIGTITVEQLNGGPVGDCTCCN